MKRLHQILLAILVVQLAVSAFVFWPRTGAIEAAEPVFPDIAADDIVALTIVDDQANEVALRKVDGAWVLPNAGNYPADETKITPLLEKLAALETDTVVTRTDASHKQLQVAEDDFLRRIDFETASGDVHTIYLGKAPRYTAAHMRVGGQSETYLTTDLATWEFNTSANNWIESSYTSIDQETLETVTLENANGTFTFVKDGDNWVLTDLEEDEEMAPGEADSIVRNASTMRILRPLGKEEEEAYGLDEPAAVVTLETADGGVHVIKAGAQDPEDNGYVVKYSDSPYYVRVQEYSVQAMVENTREDFLTEPATPEADEGESDTTTP
ncbi:MAG: DUF4340 domain-containing protein [Anaerolineae bacterium]